MSKKSSKKQKADKHRTPNVSPLILLRAQLDELFGSKKALEEDPQALKSELNAIVMNMKVPDFLPVILGVYRVASAPVQERLNEIIPEWLDEYGYTDAVSLLVKQHRLIKENQDQAIIWLETAGIDSSEFRQSQEQTLFYQAYTYSDDSQGVTIVFWYTDHRRRNVRGMMFLLDYNPPWEGAVKDIMEIPSRSPERAIQEFVGMWKRRGMTLNQINAAEAKKEILQRLEVNRREGIRLPRDLIQARRAFIEHVLTLPDTAGVASFTAEDFDKLSRSGKSAEELTYIEQTVGRRVRLEDGKELLVMGDLDDFIDEDDELSFLDDLLDKDDRE